MRSSNVALIDITGRCIGATARKCRNRSSIVVLAIEETSPDNINIQWHEACLSCATKLKERYAEMDVACTLTTTHNPS